MNYHPVISDHNHTHEGINSNTAVGKTSPKGKKQRFWLILTFRMSYERLKKMQFMMTQNEIDLSFYHYLFPVELLNDIVF